jgi:glyoxylase-like metal-dependent hydrolase (beta-lactamase superfamily II)
MRTDFRPDLEDEIRWYGYEPPERVVTAVPREDFDVSGWRTQATEPTRLLGEGDLVDLGDRVFEVLHVPGHTAGSVAFWDPAGGLLFTGDTAALDDPLHAEDEDAFVASLERLRALPVELVCAGHSRPFGREELTALIDEQLLARR